jgi:hypothetical protein
MLLTGVGADLVHILAVPHVQAVPAEHALHDMPMGHPAMARAVRAEQAGMEA